MSNCVNINQFFLFFSVNLNIEENLSIVNKYFFVYFFNLWIRFLSLAFQIFFFLSEFIHFVFSYRNCIEIVILCEIKCQTFFILILIIWLKSLFLFLWWFFLSVLISLNLFLFVHFTQHGVVTKKLEETV